MNTFRELLESIKILPDEKIDTFIKKEWPNKTVITYEYNAEASMELGKVLSDVIVTKDMKFMHIPSVLDSKTNILVNKIIKKYNIKEI